METIFSKNDIVVSHSKFSNGQYGVVLKASEKAVHVRFDNSFEKFHFNPRHHMQTDIKLLEKAK